MQNTSCFSVENLQRLRSIMYEMKLGAGEHLYWEGDASDKLYYVIDGRVKIIKTSDEGRQFVLYIYQTGDLFGQIDPYQHSLQGFHAETIEPCTIGQIQKKDLEVLIWQQGDLAIEFMKWLGLMHRMTETKFRDLLMFGKQGGLSSLLIRLCNSYGVPHPSGKLISIKFTNTDLADMIGATRESVNRMLADWKTAGMIAYQDGNIIIQQLDSLKEICHCENCPQEICRV